MPPQTVEYNIQLSPPRRRRAYRSRAAADHNAAGAAASGPSRAAALDAGARTLTPPPRTRRRRRKPTPPPQCCGSKKARAARSNAEEGCWRAERVKVWPLCIQRRRAHRASAIGVCVSAWQQSRRTRLGDRMTPAGFTIARRGHARREHERLGAASSRGRSARRTQARARLTQAHRAPPPAHRRVRGVYHRPPAPPRVCIFELRRQPARATHLNQVGAQTNRPAPCPSFRLWRRRRGRPRRRLLALGASPEGRSALEDLDGLAVERGLAGERDESSSSKSKASRIAEAASRSTAGPSKPLNSTSLDRRPRSSRPIQTIRRAAAAASSRGSIRPFSFLFDHPRGDGRACGRHRMANAPSGAASATPRAARRARLSFSKRASKRPQSRTAGRCRRARVADSRRGAAAGARGGTSGRATSPPRPTSPPVGHRHASSPPHRLRQRRQRRSIDTHPACGHLGGVAGRLAARRLPCGTA